MIDNNLYNATTMKSPGLIMGQTVKSTGAFSTFVMHLEYVLKVIHKYLI